VPGAFYQYVVIAIWHVTVWNRSIIENMNYFIYFILNKERIIIRSDRRPNDSWDV
jgi:hypothetical protein